MKLPSNRRRDAKYGPAPVITLVIVDPQKPKGGPKT